MSSKQDAIFNRVEPLGSALPEGWLGRARLIAFSIVFGIIGGTITFLITNYDSNADPIGIAGSQPSAQKSDAPAKIQPAAMVEKIKGTELNRVTLTEKAIQRLAIQTAPVREAEVARKRAAPALADPASLTDPSSLMLTSAEGSGKMQKVVPYSALLYDNHGNTWVYKCPEPLTFVRHQVTVDYIEGDVVVLSDGPATGTSVVTVGAPELYGTEFEIGH